MPSMPTLAGGCCGARNARPAPVLVSTRTTVLGDVRNLVNVGRRPFHAAPAALGVAAAGDAAGAVAVAGESAQLARLASAASRRFCTVFGRLPTARNWLLRSSIIFTGACASRASFGRPG